METGEIDRLVALYIADASRIVDCVVNAWGTSDLLTAWRSGVYPASGSVPSPDGRSIAYRFHGRGCYFTLDGLSIDVELCQDAKIIGFDSWRLLRYAEETLNRKDIEQEEIEDILKQKVASGTLSFSSKAPYFGLYHPLSDPR